MPYFNVDDQLCWHKKTVLAGNTAMGLWVRCGSWTSAQPDMDGLILADVAKAIGRPADIAALVDAGYWEPAPSGFIMHDYDDHNITSAEARKLSAIRAEAGRKGGLRRPGLSAVKGEANA